MISTMLFKSMKSKNHSDLSIHINIDGHTIKSTPDLKLLGVSVLLFAVFSTFRKCRVPANIFFRKNSLLSRNCIHKNLTCRLLLIAFEGMKLPMVYLQAKLLKCSQKRIDRRDVL